MRRDVRYDPYDRGVHIYSQASKMLEIISRKSFLILEIFRGTQYVGDLD
jgi:hypothetical protein